MFSLPAAGGRRFRDVVTGKSLLRQLITLERVRRLAGGGAFERGESYFERRRVCSVVERDGAIEAVVRGSEAYTVRLEVAGGALGHRCSCPIGEGGVFCKHCVAAALAWLESGPDDAMADSSVVSLHDVREWLVGQPVSALAGLLLEAAERDERLREKLLRLAARAAAKNIDLSAYRKAVDRAARSRGFIGYDEATGYAERVRGAIEPLHELLVEAPEQAAAVVKLAERALQQVEHALEQADDSNGEIGSLLSELQELHLEGCRIARPNPEELATRLFEWEIDDAWDVFHHAVETYAEILGEIGLATYRRLAGAEWRKLPALEPGSRESCDGPRFRLTSIMEALARTTGVVDAVVAVKSKDLSHAYAFLQIATLYREAQRHDDALAWAERGRKAFPKDTDPRLLEFLAETYHTRGRHDEAMAVTWQQFQSRPVIENYRLLKSHADRASNDAWPAWRERAIELLRRQIAEGQRQTRRPLFWSSEIGDRSTLVEIFLWENDAEAAWREAQSGECGGELRLRLAAVREKTHPADAIPIYLHRAETLIAQKNNRAYEEAARHLKKVKSLHLALGQPREWAAVYARLCTEHKAKRNFVALAAEL